ncbi:MAG TPA: peptidoglycan-binding protein, partial [Firmicutes bacterium]|nr:peptidoglycan-binding protein [Bacillota bacterium]
YYGDDITLVRDAPVRTGTPSYPGTPLRLGDSLNEVQTIQIQLNRISRNYPNIPKINETNGVFDQDTENAVRVFQETFDLPADGIVGPNTWYRIAYIYTAVKRLSELDSEGISLSEASRQYPGLLRQGDTGIGVQLVQYYLSVISAYYDSVPPVQVTGTFDQQTADAVIAFQKTYGLTPDGLVGRNTWNDLERAYNGILDTNSFEGGVALYPGEILQQGSMGDYVTYLQEYLNLIAGSYPSIPRVPVTGLFGAQTREAVMAFQQEFGLPVTGRVNVVTWDAIASLYSDLSLGQSKQPGQNPGTTITPGNGE